MAHKVVELTVLNIARAPVGLDHVHLVAILRVDVVVFNVGDGRVRSQGAHCALQVTKVKSVNLSIYGPCQRLLLHRIYVHLQTNCSRCFQ